LIFSNFDVQFVDVSLMNRIKDKYRLWVLQGVFLVTFVALFTGQFSGKYREHRGRPTYQCGISPADNLNDHDRDSHSSVFPPHFSLKLEKRDDGGGWLGSVPAFITPGFWGAESCALSSVPAETLVSPFSFSLLLRGPPLG